MYILYHPAFVIGYDGEKRIPRWVAHRIDSKIERGNILHSANGVLNPMLVVHGKIMSHVSYEKNCNGLILMYFMVSS